MQIPIKRHHRTETQKLIEICKKVTDKFQNKKKTKRQNHFRNTDSILKYKREEKYVSALSGDLEYRSEQS